MAECNFEQFALDLFKEKSVSNDEAFLRSCISRLYYGVYHRVLSWMMACFNDVYIQYGGGSHEKLRFCCDDLARAKQDLRFKTVSHKLKSLHDRRTRADYRLEQQHCRTHVEETIIEIQKINKELEMLMGKHTPTYLYKSL